MKYDVTKDIDYRALGAARTSGWATYGESDEVCLRVGLDEVL